MKVAIVFLLFTVVLVSAARYEWAEYRSYNRNMPKGAMDCLNSGGVNRDDLSNLLDDVISNNWKNLTSVKNLCIGTCIVHDRFPPGFIRTAFGDKFHSCIKDDGKHVCETAKELVSCMFGKIVKELWPVITKLMNFGS